jgi:hypothetical protein
MNDVKLEVKGAKLDLASLLSANTLSERISNFDITASQIPDTQVRPPS